MYLCTVCNHICTYLCTGCYHTCTSICHLTSCTQHVLVDLHYLLVIHKVGVLVLAGPGTVRVHIGSPQLSHRRVKFCLQRTFYKGKNKTSTEQWKQCLGFGNSNMGPFSIYQAFLTQSSPKLEHKLLMLTLHCEMCAQV